MAEVNSCRPSTALGRFAEPAIFVTLLLAIVGFSFFIGKLEQKVASVEEVLRDLKKGVESAKAEVKDTTQAAIKTIDASKAEAIREFQRDPVRTSGTSVAQNGEAVVALPQSRQGSLVAMRVHADNYDFRYWLIVAHEGFNRPGFAEPIFSRKVDDSAAVGEPTFHVDEVGSLHVRNPGFSRPANVRVEYSIIRMLPD